MAASIEGNANQASKPFSLDESRDAFRRCFSKIRDYDYHDLKEFEKCFVHSSGSDADKRAVLDQVFREMLRSLIEAESSNDKYTDLIGYSVLAAKRDLCGASCPFLLLSDLFNSITLEKCEDAFEMVEIGVSDWKSEVFYAVGKNYLLRMCNDLLRRLSKSLNTVFCGRIQLFLARLFPLSEKSGLNLMSQFNYENVTKYDLKDDELFFKSDDPNRSTDEGMEVEEGEMEENPSSIHVDYNMYRKFWSLQNCFRAPNLCYDRVQWKTFINNSGDVLTAFASCKLDDMKIVRKKLERPAKAQSYAAKYLTSSKLLDLQLNDGNFRRYILVQFLVLFHYLKSSVKFKSTEQTLNDEQSTWIDEKTDEIYKLLRETPPEGEEFATYVKHVLEREENWNAWKNEGCQSFVRERLTDEQKPRPTRGRKRSIGDDMRASAGKFVKMGSPELTKLWNLAPDNLAACRSNDRVFLPKTEKFFEDAVEQADPANQIEDQYKDYLNPSWQWRALRLLSRQSSSFFSPTNTPGLPLHDYFKSLLGKMAKEFPVQSQIEDTKELVESMKASQDEELQEPHEGEDLPSAEQLERLAARLESHWRKLATEFNFSDEDIKAIEEEGSDEQNMATRFLYQWQEDNPDNATLTALRQALKELGLVTISLEILGQDSNENT